MSSKYFIAAVLDRTNYDGLQLTFLLKLNCECLQLCLRIWPEPNVSSSEGAERFYAYGGNSDSDP